MAVTAPNVNGLTIALSHPGLSPLLRAGLGGLAASLRALDAAKIVLPGVFKIHTDRVILDWSNSNPTDFLTALFQASFGLRDCLIDLPGAFGRDLDLPTRSALQNALRQTFLQHGSSASKDGASVAHTAEIDEQQYTVQMQRYSWYVHQDQGAKIGEAVVSEQPTEMAGWANPGAVQRHVAHGSTRMEYGAETALCACFALVGCISLLTPGGGILVVPEPADLIAFADVRHSLTPRKVQDVTVGSVGDATLRAQISLRMERAERRRGVDRVSATLFRSTAWASQQKSRIDVLSAESIAPATLDIYQHLVDLLPARVNAVQAAKNKPGDIFVVPSSFRAFVADNLARGHRWYTGFSGARDLYEQERFLHLRRERDNLGALRLEEANGVRAMSEHLDEAERLLVLSVQTALRHRLGAIASENENNEHARRNRMDRERERWRLAFAGAKTVGQLRFALADLWSRGGHVGELAEGWQLVMPLVKRDWQAARDLALVALAGYSGRRRSEAEGTDDSNENPTT